MFSKIGFLAADLLNDGVTETVPCVPVIFPNPVSSCDSERSIRLEFQFPTIDDAVRVDLPLDSAKKMYCQTCSNENGVRLEDNPNYPVLFEFRTKAQIRNVSSRQQMKVEADRDGEFSFTICNSFRCGTPFQEHQTKRVRVFFPNKDYIEEYCGEIWRLIHLCHDTCDQDQSEVMNDDCE